MVRGPIGFVGILIFGWGLYVLEGGSNAIYGVPGLRIDHPLLVIALGLYFMAADVVSQIRKDLKGIRSDLKSELNGVASRIDTLIRHVADMSERPDAREPAGNKTEATLDEIRAALKAHEKTS